MILELCCNDPNNGLPTPGDKEDVHRRTNLNKVNMIDGSEGKLTAGPMAAASHTGRRRVHPKGATE